MYKIFISLGLDKESACYFVAKHGVVALTRTLGKIILFPYNVLPIKTVLSNKLYVLF